MNFIKNIIKVIIGNISVILSGVFVSFLLPKIVSVSDYGFYKTFSLYFNYLGIFSIGIIDGIVLKYGEKDLEDLDKEKFRSIFRLFLLVQIFFSVIIIGIAFVVAPEYRFITLMLGCTTIPINIIGYFQQVSQITQRFNEYSVRRIAQSTLNVVIILGLFVLYYFFSKTIHYQYYILGTLAINIIICLWYIITYRGYVFGKGEGFNDSTRGTLDLIKIGIPLMIANLCATLLFSLDRQFVSILFTTEEYAVYAFAYSMLTLCTIATSAVSLVVYPLFKRKDSDFLKNNYQIISTMVLIFSFLICLIYEPLCYFIKWFLPDYTSSLVIFRIILPGVAISAIVTIVLHNYYKVYGMSFKFFMICLIALGTSFAFNLGAYLIFKSTEAISIASIFSLLIWYYICEWELRKNCKNNLKNEAYIYLMFALFYTSTITNIHWLGFIIQIVGFAAITIGLYYKDLLSIKELLVARNNKNQEEQNIEENKKDITEK